MSLLFLLRKLKGSHSITPHEHSHAFLLTNGEKLIAISNSGKDEFQSTENYETYKNLIRSLNRSTNTVISLLGEHTEDTSYFDQHRKGAPPVGDDLESLANSTIKHYRLENSIYDEFHSITLAPSHNFPIQSSRFRLGRSAPIISTSLEPITDDPEVKSFIFFLSSHTLTISIEQEFIISEFGKDAEIIIDPAPELLLEKLKSNQYNTIYISAHGEYDHWESGDKDEIFFNDNSRITAKALGDCAQGITSKRNIILNICDGATTTISCNPYSRGISATIARGNQTVISHLWPVNPIYACTFGALNLHLIKSMPAIESARKTFEILNDKKELIPSKIKAISPSFSILSEFLEQNDFNFRSFKNIGSVAVYS